MLQGTLNTLNVLDHGDLAIHLLTDIRCQTVCHRQKLQQFHDTLSHFISAFVTAEELQLPVQCDLLKRLQTMLPIVEDNLRQTKQQLMALAQCLANDEGKG